MKHKLINLARRCMPFITLFIVCSLTWAEEQSVTFTYNPPTGATYDEQYTRTTTMRYQGKRNVKEIYARGVTRIVKDAERAQFISALIDINMRDNGKRVVNPILEAMKGVMITLVTDDEGKYISIDGHEDQYHRVTMTSSVQSVKPLDEELKAIADREQVIWRNRISRFVGQQIHVGEQWLDTAEIVLPSREVVPMYRQTTISGWKEVQGRRVLCISTVCHSSVKGLATRIGKSAEEILAVIPVPIAPYIESNILYINTVEVDPTTMQVFSDQTSVTVAQYEYSSSGKRIPRITVEVTNISMAYR